MSALIILLVPICCLITGAVGVSIVLSGSEFIPFAPLFAVFGWYYLLPIYMLAALIWQHHDAGWQFESPRGAAIGELTLG